MLELENCRRFRQREIDVRRNHYYIPASCYDELLTQIHRKTWSYYLVRKVLISVRYYRRKSITYWYQDKVSNEYELHASPSRGVCEMCVWCEWRTKNCVLLIDESFIGMNRPGGSTKFKRLCYKGHKWKHGLKYEGLIATDGLCLNLHGHEIGLRHDMFMFESSELEEELLVLLLVQGEGYVEFGDSGCHERHWLQCS